MIALLIGWLAPTIGEKWAKPLAYALLIISAALLLWGAKALYDRSVVNHHEQQVEQRAKPATDQAATERANDAIANAKHEEDLHNAVHSVPDAAPAGPSHALACKRLSNAGKRLPASCRPAGSH
jgi:ABC-type nickel/cobalt efflux system permease component RcnA